MDLIMQSAFQQRRLGIYNTMNDLSNNVCVPNKTEDLNLSAFNMITEINYTKTLTKRMVTGHWGELWVPNLTWMFLMKCYWMLQGGRVTVFTVSNLSRENQQGIILTLSPNPRDWG